MLSRARVLSGSMRRASKTQKRFGGAFFCMLASVLVKGVGALYKIPLAGALGAEGIGLYQMIFPLYALLLTLSGSAAPQALTRILASGYSVRSSAKKSFLLFGSLSVIFSVFLVFFGQKIGKLQGNAAAGELYKIIAPSLVICSFIAVLRGIIQGGGDYLPTALSQIIEQCVRAVIGLALVYTLSGGALLKAALATLAVTLSEVAALGYLLFAFFKRAAKQSNANEVAPEPEQKIELKTENDGKRLSCKKLLFYVVPLCVALLIMPLAAFLDGFIGVNALKLNFDNAVSLYGAFAGASETVIALPAGALGAFCSASLPKLNSDSRRKKLFLGTAGASIIAAACVFLFGNDISRLLFSSLGEYVPLVASLLKYSAVNVIFQSLLGCSNVILLSLDKQAVSLASLFFALCLKITLNALLIKIARINVFGLVISDSCFYLLALFLNLGYIIYRARKTTRAQGV